MESNHTQVQGELTERDREEFEAIRAEMRKALMMCGADWANWIQSCNRCFTGKHRTD